MTKDGHIALRNGPREHIRDVEGPGWTTTSQRVEPSHGCDAHRKDRDGTMMERPSSSLQWMERHRMNGIAAKRQTKQNNIVFQCSTVPQFTQHDVHDKGGQTRRGILILCPPPFENGVGWGGIHVPSTLSRGRCKSLNDGACV